MSPEEILRKADEARGNMEGVEWEIVIKSIEGGRERNRTVRASARNLIPVNSGRYTGEPS